MNRNISINEMKFSKLYSRMIYSKNYIIQIDCYNVQNTFPRKIIFRDIMKLLEIILVPL